MSEQVVNESPLRVAYITSGAAGMYCGSCLHDNTLARALTARGIDMQLIPTYTPIRTDEPDVSIDRVFMGGINVFLQEKLPLFRHLPEWLSRVFDQRWLLRLAASRGMKTSPRDLGALTVSMLQGRHGHQRSEVNKLCHWLQTSPTPQIVVLSNMLIGGCIPALKERLRVPVLVTLQGDDIFLDSLPEPFRSRAFTEIRRLVADVDGFLVHSRYYAEFMAGYFSIPAERLHVVPLGIDTADFLTEPAEKPVSVTTLPPTVGYLARLAPEKGLHVLVDAFLELRQRAETRDARLRIAGWLGPNQRTYADGLFEKLRDAGLDDAYEYVGEVDRRGKVEFLRSIDVLSVPTTYHEPKGLFVLEALAAGVPVVQPDHGAFPELLAATGGGRLVTPNDPRRLADALHDLLVDAASRIALGRAGRAAVLQNFNAQKMAEQTLAAWRKFV